MTSVYYEKASRLVEAYWGVIFDMKPYDQEETFCELDSDYDEFDAINDVAGTLAWIDSLPVLQ